MNEKRYAHSIIKARIKYMTVIQNNTAASDIARLRLVRLITALICLFVFWTTDVAK